MTDNKYEYDGVKMPPPTPNEHHRNFAPLKPPSWLWLSVLVTLCCFPIFGIVGFVNGIQVNSHYRVGNYERAEHYSRRARLWNLLGIVIGVIYYIIVLITMSKGNFLEGLSQITGDGVYSIYNY